MTDVWTRVYRVFDPLRPPVGELERFYADRPVSIADQIAEAIRMSHGDIKLVLTGQKGSGKTTELIRVVGALKDEFFPVWLDVESRLNILNVNHLEILIGATAMMYKTADEKGIVLDRGPLDRITETINKVTRKRGASLDLSTPKLLEMAVGALKLGLSWETVREINVEPEVSDILASISESIACLQERTGYLPLWIVDGLDKVEFEIAKRIFAESSLLAQPPCSVIYTVPFALFHSPQFHVATGFFSATASREVPNVLLFTRDEGASVKEGYDFFQELVNKRLEMGQAEGFIESQALKWLIHKSGGVVRELIYLVQEADQEARHRRIERIDATCAQRAIERYKRQKIKGLDSKWLSFLCRVYKEKPTLLPSEGISEDIRSELQAALYILYYEDGGQWYWTHPVLEDFLKEQCPKENP
ncbi:MAG: hypothetical protein HY652_05170 [Acidobacteria bacterium]|nr:hypothetical protein [Acidobacteriota bacterium]